MRQKLAIGMTSLLCLASTQLIAAEPHTWHTINSTAGTWEVKLQMLNQGGSFVSRDGDTISNITINPSHPIEYGFIFDQGDDFDVAYTLTAVQQESKLLHTFTSKACVYVVTANGPAQPDIRVSTFNGAKCDWQVIHGVGENFSFS